MSNTEILAERGGLKLVLNKTDGSEIPSVIFEITVGKAKIILIHKRHRVISWPGASDYIYSWDYATKLGDPHYSNSEESVCIQEASKMAIEWFNSLFENVQ